MLRAKADAPELCKSNERKDLGETRVSRQHACVQSVHQVRFDILRRDVREFVLTEPRPEKLQRTEVQPVGVLAPERRFGTVRKEPVRPLVEGDPTVRRGARQQPVAGELLITPSKRAFWRNGSASLISRMAAIHSDRDARWRPGRPSLPLHRSCRGDREPFGWDRACSWNRTEVRNRRFPSCSAVGRGSIGR